VHLASRLEEPLPGLLEGRREDGNGFGVEGYFGLNQINNAGHSRTPAPKQQLGRWNRAGIAFRWLRRFNSLKSNGFLQSSVAAQQIEAASDARAGAAGD
jgi:hypothetical protein